MKYHIADDDQQRGPYTLDELWRVEFGPDTLVWHDGMPDWQRADSIADLRVVLAGKMPPPSTSPSLAGDFPPEPDDLELKIPTGVRPVERVTVYPGAYPAQPSAEHEHPAGQGLQYAAGAYAHGPLPVGAAVTSLVLGILALLLSFFALCLWVFSGPLAIAAIVVGHVARHNARRGTAGGDGMALAGLICGYGALALTAFFMLTFLGIMAGA